MDSTEQCQLAPSIFRMGARCGAAHPPERFAQQVESRVLAGLHLSPRVCDNGFGPPALVARSAGNGEIFWHPQSPSGTREQVLCGEITPPRVAAAPDARPTISRYQAVERHERTTASTLPLSYRPLARR